MVSTDMEIELTAKAARLYKSGVRVKKILKETELTKNKFDYLIYKKLGCQNYHGRKTGKVKKEPNPLTEQQKQRIEQLFRFGYNYREIAEDLKLTTKQVRDARERNTSGH